jgi:hypothetical protein
MVLNGQSARSSLPALAASYIGTFAGKIKLLGIIDKSGKVKR